MERKKNVEACLVIVTGLLIIYYFKHWEALLIASAVVGLTGIFFDKPASWITWLWYKIGEAMGAVVSNIMLSAVYFIFLFPIALLYRMTGNDRLDITSRKKNTLWTDRKEHTYTRGDLENPW